MQNKPRQSKKKLDKDLLIDTKMKGEDDFDENLFKTDRDYVRQVCQKSIKEVKSQKEAQNVVFGTQEGSLGALIQISEYTYHFLSKLSKEMEN